MGSSAAPTYFPSYKRQIDAAVMCNNPALAAISVLMSEKVEAPKTPQQIHILSLGTGVASYSSAFKPSRLIITLSL